MTQDELAAALDVTRTHVSNWENNRRRPKADQLEALAEALDDGGDLIRWPVQADGEHSAPLFETQVSVTGLLRQAADGLIEHLSVDKAVDARPGYGWRHDLDDTAQPLSALSTAYALKAVMLAGGRDWRVSLPDVRAMLRRLELPDGGWSALTKSPLARPEVTAVVIAALHDAGESHDYLTSRTDLLVETLRRRVEGSEPARPYVLTTSLLELSRLDLEVATARRFLDDLVDLSLVDTGTRSWPVVVRTSGIAASGPSVVHTASAVCALAAWGRRLDDDRLAEVARSGRAWLEQNGDLDLDDERIRSERADGGEEELSIRHFTPAWVVRALIEAGGDAKARVVSRALRETLSYYTPAVALWRWPRGGGSYPVWMTYHGLAALVAWAGAREIG